MQGGALQSKGRERSWRVRDLDARSVGRVLSAVPPPRPPSLSTSPHSPAAAPTPSALALPRVELQVRQQCRSRGGAAPDGARLGARVLVPLARRGLAALPPADHPPPSTPQLLPMARLALLAVAAAALIGEKAAMGAPAGAGGRSDAGGAVGRARRPPAPLSRASIAKYSD